MTAVSVLLPCRDAGGTLEACLESLWRQSFGDFEVVAVDDGSTDATPEILDRESRREPRLRVISAAAEGIVPALSRAVEEARAPLLARMDADDLAHSRRLELQVARLEDSRDLAACGTGVRFFPRQSLGSGMRRYESWLNSMDSPDRIRGDLFVECPIAHPSLMIRAEALRAAGGYRDEGWPEDYDLLLRLHRAGMRCASVTRRLHLWRLGPDRLSMRSERYSPEAFRRCKVHHLLEGPLPDGRPVVVWGAGSVGKDFGLELLRQGGRVEAWVDLDPGRIGQEIHGAPVLSPADFAPEERPYVLAAVGTPGARSQIREWLASAGLEEMADYRVVA